MDVNVAEFPFVEALPKREGKRTLSRWEVFKEFVDLCERKGPPIGTTLAAELLGVSKQRVYDFIKEGRLEVVEDPLGRSVITGNSFIEFCHQERKNGRPTLVESESFLSAAKRGIRSLKK